MKHKQSFPTSVQHIALRLVFDVMDEEQINRTYAEYMDIAHRLPPLKVLHALINERLDALHQQFGSALPEICRFKAGDKRIVYEPYPKTISYETLRAALIVAGMREPRRRRS